MSLSVTQCWSIESGSKEDICAEPCATLISSETTQQSGFEGFLNGHFYDGRLAEATVEIVCFNEGIILLWKRSFGIVYA